MDALRADLRDEVARLGAVRAARCQRAHALGGLDRDSVPAGLVRGGREQVLQEDVVVDFSDTTFIDSTTLGVLVGGVKRLRAQEGRLSLVCSDRNIRKIFEITGLDRVFTIYPTRDEALAKTGASTQS